jgi:hypothetical protein
MHRDQSTVRTFPRSLSLRRLPVNTSLEAGDAAGLSLTVVFTTIHATLGVLGQGVELASGLGARIRILALHVVPYPLALDCPHVDPEFKVRRFRTLLVDGAVETRIDVILCRNPHEAITISLRPHSLVLIGGRKHWWPTRETRLAKRLRRAGHHVLFMPQS